MLILPDHPLSVEWLERGERDSADRFLLGGAVGSQLATEELCASSPRHYSVLSDGTIPNNGISGGKSLKRPAKAGPDAADLLPESGLASKKVQDSQAINASRGREISESDVIFVSDSPPPIAGPEPPPSKQPTVSHPINTVPSSSPSSSEPLLPQDPIQQKWDQKKRDGPTDLPSSESTAPEPSVGSGWTVTALIHHLHSAILPLLPPAAPGHPDGPAHLVKYFYRGLPASSATMSGSRPSGRREGDPKSASSPAASESVGTQNGCEFLPKGGTSGGINGTIGFGGVGSGFLKPDVEVCKMIH